MSYCEVIFFNNGKPDKALEFRNARGGAAFIWDSLFEKYLKDPEKEYDNFLSACRTGDTSLWDLAKREDLPMFMRAVHASTFDRAIIRRENFGKFAGHLREFVAFFGTRGNVCHLQAWADSVQNAEAEAVGFYGTSIEENLWYDWDKKAEDYIPYNLNERTDHFEVYDFLTGGEQSV